MAVFWHKDMVAPRAESAQSIPDHAWPLWITGSYPEVDRLWVEHQPVLEPTWLCWLLSQIARAGDIREAVNALLSKIEEQFHPSLVCVVLVDREAQGTAYLACRAGGQVRDRLFDHVGIANLGEMRKASSTYWISLARSLLAQTCKVPDPATDPVGWPLQTTDGVAGTLLLWPEPSAEWAAADLAQVSALLPYAVPIFQRLLLQQAMRSLRQELNQCEARLADMQERMSLSEGLASIGRLVSGIAHELSTPLTLVTAYAQLLRDGDAPEAMRSDLGLIRAEAQRCHRIVQSVLHLSRQRNASGALTSVNDAVQRTLELKTYALQRDHIEIVTDLQPDMPSVLVNPYRLLQTLLNIVNNAHEAMSAARDHGVLTISTRVLPCGDHVMVRIAVADDGPGVPEPLRERVFEPFFTTKHESGTGLGLSLSRQFVSEAGGRLWLDPTYPTGARFWIELPAALQPPGLARFALQTEPVILPSIPRSADPSTRALIIEDDRDVAGLLQRLLQPLCSHMVHASSGEQAMALLSKEEYDLAVLDLRMPRTDGQQVYQAIVERFPYLLPRLVFVTGDTVCTKTQEWLLSTGCPVLEKPFDLAQFYGLVERLLQIGV